jgi:formylglycine-generating enzyme required for sulfatase activity
MTSKRYLDKINVTVPGLLLTLPTEAQWEYACRAGTTTPFSLGDNMTPEQVNYDGNYPYTGAAKGTYRKQTAPVSSLPPNPWGLYEMHGNVYEWCRDGMRAYTEEAQSDPVGPLEIGVPRVVRGGSWVVSARSVRSASRDAFEPDYRYSDLGFRCARVQQGEQGQGGLATGRVAEQRPEPGPAEGHAKRKKWPWSKV